MNNIDKSLLRNEFLQLVIAHNQKPFSNKVDKQYASVFFDDYWSQFIDSDFDGSVVECAKWFFNEYISFTCAVESFA